MKLLLAAALAGILILSARLQKSGARASESLERVELLVDSLRFVRTERSMLAAGLASLSRRHWRARPSLIGTDVVTGARRALSIDSADVLYVLDEACPACLQNLPLLDSLAHEGVRVLAISHHGSRESLSTFRESRRVSYPVLVDPTGELSDFTNVYVTPVSLVLSRGRVSLVRVGRISRDDVLQASHARGIP